MLPGLFEKHFIVYQILESGVKRLKLLENASQLSVFVLRIISRASKRARSPCSGRGIVLGLVVPCAEGLLLFGILSSTMGCFGGRGLGVGREGRFCGPRRVLSL